MRLVEFCKKGWFGGQNSATPVDIQAGHFHGFFQEGDLENGIEITALVENENGIIEGVGARQVRFINTPTESNSGSAGNSN